MTRRTTITPGDHRQAAAEMNGLGSTRAPREHLRALQDGLLITPSRRPYDEMSRRRRRALDDAWTAPGRTPTALLRMALPSRHHAGAAGCRRRRARAPDLLHRLRHAPHGDPGRALHDRGRGGPRSAARTTRPTARRNCRRLRSQALKARTGCLLANHGMIATGPISARRCGWRSSSRRSPAIYLCLELGRPENPRRRGDRGYDARSSRITARGRRTKARAERRPRPDAWR